MELMQNELPLTAINPLNVLFVELCYLLSMLSKLLFQPFCSQRRPIMNLDSAELSFNREFEILPSVIVR